MKIMPVLALMFFTTSCIQSNVSSDYVLDIKKALIRSRNITNISENIDASNTAEFSFLSDFPNQLIELNLEISPMSNSELTVLNQNGEQFTESKKNKIDSSGTLDVLLNNQSISSCLVAQCEEIKCSSSDEGSLKVFFKSDKIFLNLSKVSSSCVGNLLTNGLNNLKFIYVNNANGAIYQGVRLKAQIITYNMTYTPKGMKNVIN